MSYLEKYFQKVPADKRDKAAIASLAALDAVQESDPQIAGAILQELRDQRSHLKLIASENFSSLPVQLAMGNWLTDKYSEGYPGRRFYAGCENVDRVESAAMEQAKTLFGCDHAYVQPHSGADANLVAYWSILVGRVQSKQLERLGKKNLDELSPEEYEEIRQQLVNQKVMGMSLNAGGHLTHGYRHNISSKFMRSIPYEVERDTGLLNYDALREQIKKEKPAILVAGYSAYPRLINFAIMREIADTVQATFMVDMAHFAGLVAGKAIQGDYNPIPFAHIITSTTHKTLRGPRGGLVLCKNEWKTIIDKGCPLVLGGPLPHVMAAKAIAFKEAALPSFADYARQIIANSKALAQHLLAKGITLTTGGTDNHLLVVNTSSSFGLTGREAEIALRESKMTVNRNAIPYDQNGPWYTSGIRIGTPALTTLGMREGEMRRIAEMLVELLQAARPSVPGKVTVDPKALASVRKQVDELLSSFPLYPELVI